MTAAAPSGWAWPLRLIGSWLHGSRDAQIATLLACEKENQCALEEASVRITALEKAAASLEHDAQKEQAARKEEAETASEEKAAADEHARTLLMEQERLEKELAHAATILSERERKGAQDARTCEAVVAQAMRVTTEAVSLIFAATTRCRAEKEPKPVGLTPSVANLQQQQQQRRLVQQGAALGSPAADLPDGCPLAAKKAALQQQILQDSVPARHADSMYKAKAAGKTVGEVMGVTFKNDWATMRDSTTTQARVLEIVRAHIPDEAKAVQVHHDWEKAVKTIMRQNQDKKLGASDARRRALNRMAASTLKKIGCIKVGTCVYCDLHKDCRTG